MNIFFDRNLPSQMARMVEVFDVKKEHTIVHHNERFHEKTTDVEWINALNADANHWTVITQDYAIMKNRLERDAFKNSKLTMFFMKDSWRHLPIHEKAWKFLRVWPNILSAASSTKRGAFEVPVNSVKCVHLPI